MKLYQFQKEALEKTKNNRNALYAYDMGLGKTFIGSEKMRLLSNYNNLVVCQKTKIGDWIEHFQKYYDDYNVYDLTKKKQFEQFFEDLILESQTSKVAIINYDLIWRRQYLLKLRYYTLMLDESSMIQNETTRRTKFILKMQPSNVILLSGTVINGNYEKLWTQSKLLG